ncbi:MAG: FAD-dependent oxidoreductase [Nitrospira sp.]
MSLAEMTGLGQTALALKRLGKEDMRDFLRVLLMNVYDLLDEQLSRRPAEGPARLRRDARLASRPALADLAARPLLSARRRDRRPCRRAGPAPKGGMGAVVAAIRAAAEKAGVSIRPASPVAKVVVEKGRAVGVVTQSGETLRARTVVSAINPATTILDLVGPREVDTGFVRKVKNIRMKGDAAKLHLALDRPPQFSGVDAAGHKGRLVIAPSPDHVERAFNPSKYGEFSPEPVMEITLPSLADPSLAPVRRLRAFGRGAIRALCAETRAGPPASRNSSRRSWRSSKPMRPASARRSAMPSC